MRTILLAAALLAAAKIEAQNVRLAGAGMAVNGLLAQQAGNFTPANANLFPPPVVYRVMAVPLTNPPAATVILPGVARVQAAPVTSNGASYPVIARARP